MIHPWMAISRGSECAAPKRPNPKAIDLGLSRFLGGDWIPSLDGDKSRHGVRCPKEAEPEGFALLVAF